MGAIFAMFSAWYYWIPKILGLSYDMFAGKVHFWTLFLGVNRKIYYRRFHEGPDFPKHVVYFVNFNKSKKRIYRELRRKSGVYLFINNITKDLYVGSSLNLTKRMRNYFFYTNNNKDSKLVIIRAMKKYGLDNFSLAVLEFCECNIKTCHALEQKWIDYYKPRYNTLKIAGSSYGFKHKIETINKLKKLLSNKNHPNYGKITSIETREAISRGVKNFYSIHRHSFKGMRGEDSPQYGIGGLPVFFYNKKGEELIFPSINGARQHFKVRWTYIKNNIDSNKWIKLKNDEWIIQSHPRSD